MRFSSSQEPEDDPESRESAGVETRDGVRVLSDEGPSSNRSYRLMTDGGADEEGEGDEDEESDEGEGEEEEGGDEGEEEEEGEEGEEGGDEGEEGAEEEGEGAEEGEGEEEEGGEGESAKVLHLDLEGLFLNLLGLEVDLNEVVLDVDAVKGENNLLGNLLSGVAGLLKPMSGGGLGSLLGGLPSVGDLLGGSGGEGEEGEEGGGMPGWVSSAKETVSDSASSALEDVDVNDLLTQVLKEFVSELFGDSSEESSESDGESSS